MGRKDYRWREKKKPKKGAVKTTNTATILTSPVTVEVIKKGKKTPPPIEE